MNISHIHLYLFIYVFISNIYMFMHMKYLSIKLYDSQDFF